MLRRVVHSKNSFLFYCFLDVKLKYLTAYCGGRELGCRTVLLWWYFVFIITTLLVIATVWMCVMSATISVYLLKIFIIDAISKKDTVEWHCFFKLSSLSRQLLLPMKKVCGVFSCVILAALETTITATTPTTSFTSLILLALLDFF